jgi:hypothetical protein
MDVKKNLSEKIIFSPEKLVENLSKNIYTILPENRSILTNPIMLNIDADSKLYFNIYLILFIVISNIILLSKRWIFDKKNEDYIQFYNDLYYDLFKYLIIESALILTETIENNKINVTSSLARVSVVLIALIIFHYIKCKIGLEQY